MTKEQKCTCGYPNTDACPKHGQAFALPATPCSNERLDRRLRSKIGGFLLEPDSQDGGDTLAVALCSYFEKHMHRPKPDPETENGWGRWAEEKANAALDALTRTLSGNSSPVETPAPQFTHEQLEFVRNEMYASLSNGATDPLFQSVYDRAKELLRSPVEPSGLPTYMTGTQPTGELPLTPGGIDIRQPEKTFDSPAPCRIHEYDGAFKCLTHQRTWGAVGNPQEPCSGWSAEKAPCERCEGSGRLTIYDTAMYAGQACSPIGDEPCPACQPENGSEEQA